MTEIINPLAPALQADLSNDAKVLAKHNIDHPKSNIYATVDADVIRKYKREGDEPSLLRPAFIRDIEKILHTPAYNRLNGKTQVFSFRANDDITKRGLHEQLVGRVALDIGRALGLNLDLIEAIALGHDVGHTPFGHTGEHYLNKVYHQKTGRWFFHNVQSVRVLSTLYPRNLSLQTLDGILCHNGEFELQKFRTSELQTIDQFEDIVEGCWTGGANAIATLRPMTLEGCVMRISDIIAYVGKDRQDAIRMGIATEDSFDDGLGSKYGAWAMSHFVADIVEHSLGKDTLEMSEEAFLELKRAKRENYQKIYGSAEVSGDFSDRFGQLFELLFDHELQMLKEGREDSAIFVQHIIPIERHNSHYDRNYDWQKDLAQCACDFIAAMTDDYFIATCLELFDEAKELIPSYSYFASAKTNTHVINA